jgi:large subunit ribosomal protein L15
MNMTQVLSVGRHRGHKRRGLGSGSGMGKQAGRGNKGYGQHAGKGLNPLYEGGQMPFFRRLPKKGFSGQPFKMDYAEVNVGTLARFGEGAKVGPEELLKAGVVQHLLDGIKVLGAGTAPKGLAMRAHKFSAAAKAKIEAAGGSVEIITTAAYRLRRELAAAAPAGRKT